MAVNPAQAHIDREGSLRAARSEHEATWDLIQKFIFPAGAPFQFAPRRGQGSRVHVLDNTGEEACEQMAAGLHAMLTNPALQWFALRPVDTALLDNEQVKRWTETATERMYALFLSPQTNFTAAAHQAYLELASYGTGVMFAAERPGQLPYFSARPIADVVIDEDDEARVDTVYWKFRMTARQAAQKWGMDALGEKLAKAAGDVRKQDEKFEFLHAVFPRQDGRDDAVDARQMRWASLWISVDDKMVIRESGFRSMPYIVVRWLRPAGMIYGRGAGTKALPDVMMLQRYMRATIRAAEKTIDPALQAADDGVMGPVTLKSGGVNYVRAELLQTQGGAIRPITTGSSPTLGEQLGDRVRFRIQVSFMKELMQLSRDPRMTATQSLQLEEEQLRGMSPIVGRMETEFLGPLIDRVFDIMQRGDMLPAPPLELPEGAEIRGEFASPIARAQRLAEARTIAQFIDFILPLAQADPSVMDVVDLPTLARGFAERTGVPLDVVNPPDVIERAKQARRSARDQIAELEAAKDLSTVAKNAAPALQVLQGQGTAGGADRAAASDPLASGGGSLDDLLGEAA